MRSNVCGHVDQSSWKQTGFSHPQTPILPYRPLLALNSSTDLDAGPEQVSQVPFFSPLGKLRLEEAHSFAKGDRAEKPSVVLRPWMRSQEVGGESGTRYAPQ